MRCGGSALRNGEPKRVQASLMLLLLRSLARALQTFRLILKPSPHPRAGKPDDRPRHGRHRTYTLIDNPRCSPTCVHGFPGSVSTSATLSSHCSNACTVSGFTTIAEVITMQTATP